MNVIRVNEPGMEREALAEICLDGLNVDFDTDSIARGAVRVASEAWTECSLADLNVEFDTDSIAKGLVRISSPTREASDGLSANIALDSLNVEFDTDSIERGAVRISANASLDGLLASISEGGQADAVPASVNEERANTKLPELGQPSAAL